MHRQLQSNLQQSRPRLLAGALGLLLPVLLAGGFAAASLAQPAQRSLVVVEVAQGIFEDARVQRALTVAAPWQRMAEGSGLQPDAVQLRHGDRETALDAPQADPDAVQQLLAEAGITRREPRPYALFYAPALERLAETTLKVLAQYGLEGQLQVMTPQTRERLLATTRYATGNQRAEIPYLILSQEQQTAPEPPRLADLAIFGEMVIDYDAGAGLLTVTTGVANIGRAPVRAQQLMVFERGRVLQFAPVRIEQLGVQETGAFKAVAKVPEELLGKEVQLQAVVDPENRLPETNEDNNRGPVVPYRLPAPPRSPDLAILEPPQLAYDEAARRLTITVVVINLGAAPAGPHELAITDRGGTLQLQPLPVEGLGPREKQDVRLTLPIPEASLGARLILEAAADPGNAIRESNEENNISASAAFTLPSPIPRPIPRPADPAPHLADLQLDRLGLDIDPETRRLSVTVAAANRGEADAGPHDLWIVESDGRVAFPPIQIENLAAGETRQVSGSVTLGAELAGATLRLQAVTDAAAQVTESREDNNRSPVERFMVPAPQGQADLVIVAMQVRRSLQGDALEVRLTIANRGSAPSAASEIEVSAEGAGASQRFDLPVLASGATTDVTWTLPAPAPAFGGQVTVSAFADPDDRLAELLETNNGGRQVLTLPPARGTWIVGAGLLALLTLALLWGLRRRRPEAKHKAADLRLSYRAAPDPGVQKADTVGPDSLPPVRLTLRPVRDPGRQLVDFSAQN